MLTMMVMLPVLTVMLITWRDVGANDVDVKDLARSVNKFSYNLYKCLAVNKTNVIYSGLSAHAALSMAYMGARDNTADQMKSVLQLTNVKNPHKYYESILLQYIGESNIKVLTAFGMWLKSSFAIKQEYKDDAASFYLAVIDNIDDKAVGGPEAPINNWVANKTEDKINSLLKPGYITANTALVLVNTLFFNGAWQSLFKTHLTKEGPFHRPDGSTVQVFYMNQVNFYYLKKSYLGNDIIRISFKNTRFSFYVALPTTPESLTALEQSLIGEVSGDESLFQGLERIAVNLTLPKFNLDYTLNLINALERMGMMEAFTLQANFTGITPIPIAISHVIQKAIIEVNEHGIVASAATAVLFGVTSANMRDPYTFKVDRPFLFFIRDEKLSLNLFQGKCSDPTVVNIVV